MSYGSYFAQVAREAGLAKAPEEALSRPHHITNSSGKVFGFKNIYESWGKGVSPIRIMFSFLKLALKGELNSPDIKNPPISICKPDFLPSRFTKNLRATWLGHACYYVEFPSGLRILFDPVFEDRCSPFSMLGPKRYTQIPCDLADIPVVDAVVISHSHYDHLSHPSVQELQKYHPQAHFFVGLGLEKWFRASGITNVTEMDWWENAQLKLVRQTDGFGLADVPETIEVTISCLPCQHTSARTLWDKDTTLWCSWAVTSSNKSVWFGGDTGYRAVPYYPPTIDDYAANPDLPKCPQFKQIGDLRGPFNLGLIPIGAYSPRVAFSPMHANPFDAVEIYKDIRCQRGMGIHWGTWALTTEDVMEPPTLLKKALEVSGLEQSGIFDTCAIGESREFPNQ